jgi:formylmethanofuran dehydrogenase subunit A
MSTLASLTREYTLYEIAIMTRAAPAKTLGLADRGHLGPGAAADITVYSEDADKEKMFAKPDYVFKDGELVAQNGKVVKVTWGNTHVVKPEYDQSIEKQLKSYFERYQTIRMDNFKISDDEMYECGHGSKLITHACRKN